MFNLNEVRLAGRLTRDPDLRSTPNGAQQVASFGLAVNRRYKGADGNLKDDTTFVEITCWGKLADTVYKYLRKGRSAFIAGRLRFDSWDDKQTGQKRSRLTVVAESVQFLDRAENTGGGAPYGSPQPGYAAQQPGYAAPQPGYAPPQHNSNVSSAPRDEWAAPPDYPVENPSEWNEPPADEPPF